MRGADNGWLSLAPPQAGLRPFHFLRSLSLSIHPKCGFLREQLSREGVGLPQVGTFLSPVQCRADRHAETILDRGPCPGVHCIGPASHSLVGLCFRLSLYYGRDEVGVRERKRK